MARPIASVILPLKNEAPRLEACLSALASQKSRIPFEVHLVDNGSSDGTYAKARRLVRDLKLKDFFVWKEPKPGSPAALNHGARKARGDILLFTVADAELAPRWVEELSRPLRKPAHYPLAALGGATESVLASQKKKNLWERYLFGVFTFWENERLAPAFLPWSPARNFAVRTEIFRALGGFDERWRTAVYDVDFCWRLSLSGFVLGHAPLAKVRLTRRPSLRGFLRQMENYAYFRQSLSHAYQKELRLPIQAAQQLFLQGQRLVSLLRSTTNISQAGFRGLDSLVTVATLKGSLEARMKGAKPNPKLAFGRRGETPAALQGKLSRGYSHLHRQGWCYWKSPADIGEEGDLLLFDPRRNEKYRLESTSWKIWEVKAERGQSEDAAEVLGQSPNDESALQRIDQLTIDLHTRRLLP